MSQTLKNLQMHMSDAGMSQAALARALDKSTSVVSQYLNGKYTGDVAALERDISAYLSRQADRRRAQRVTIPFVATATAKKISDVIDMAALDIDINVVYGAAGLGKTVALRTYAESHPDALLIESDPGYTGKVFLQVLAGRLGLATRGTVHDLLDSVVARLRGSGRVLLVDEAELLPLNVLEIIRRIHDHAQIGVVLAGMPRLICNLRGARGELAQLYSRVGFAINLGNQLPADDVRKISGEVLDDAAEPVIAAVVEHANGNARRLTKLLRGVRRVSQLNETEPTAQIVRSVAETLVS